MIQRTEDEILQEALEIAERRMTYGIALESPDAVRTYLRIWAAKLTEEAFGAVWLTSKHEVIAVDTLFHGTIDGATVYPRLVVRTALDRNAAAVIVFHNHPSGYPEPSLADSVLTKKLKEALATVDVRLLDHFVVGATLYSFAENGWV